MIDTNVEMPITFRDAAEKLPRRRAGKPGSQTTIYRWSTEGCRGVVLETIQIGATRCTSREAMQRFYERLEGVKPTRKLSPGVAVGA